MSRYVKGESIWISAVDLAIICECHVNSIYKAKKNGRITKDSMSKDGRRFHKELAARDFKENKVNAGHDTEDDGAEENDGPDLSGLPTDETIELLDSVIQDFKNGKPPPENGKFTYNACRAVREAINTTEAWIRLKKLESEIIEKADAIAQVQTICKHNRDSWLNFPQLVSVEMAHDLGVDSGLLHDVLLKAVKYNLEKIATLDIQIPGIDPEEMIPIVEATPVDQNQGTLF